jgi:hypothetical protein
MDTDFDVDVDDSQSLFIKQLLNMLDLNDEKPDNDNKHTPFNIKIKSSYGKEYFPYDIKLELDCINGYNCKFKKTPLICPFNHQNLGRTLNKNNLIPNLFCRYERPWKNNKYNEPLRCTNRFCWFSHMEGRVKILQNIILN